MLTLKNVHNRQEMETTLVAMQTEHLKYMLNFLSIPLPYISPYGHSELLRSNHCLQLPAPCCYQACVAVAAGQVLSHSVASPLTPKVANVKGD